MQPASFQCSLCPKSFTRSFALRNHLNTHENKKPFLCTICGKAFTRNHDRKTHEGLHAGERRFVCKHIVQDGRQLGCGRRFARATNLERHRRSRGCIRPSTHREHGSITNPARTLTDISSFDAEEPATRQRCISDTPATQRSRHESTTSTLPWDDSTTNHTIAGNGPFHVDSSTLGFVQLEG